MKKYLIALFLTFTFANIYAVPTAVYFRISDPYVDQGISALLATNPDTHFWADFSVQRGTSSSGWEAPYACVVDIVLLKSDRKTVKKSLSNPYSFVTNDFTTNYTSKSLSGKLPLSDVGSGDYVGLRFTYTNRSNVKVTSIFTNFYSIRLPAGYTIPNPGNPNPGNPNPGNPNPTDPTNPTWPAPGEPGSIGSSGNLTTMAGIDINSSDEVIYYGTSGKFTVGTSTSISGATWSYALPSSKRHTDIIDIAIANSGYYYVWYKDGTMSVGSQKHLGDYIAPKGYILPAGKTPSDIAGISINKTNNYCFTWYKDGTVSQGTSTNLGAYQSPYPYSVAPGKSYSDIVDMGIATSSGWVYAWYSDHTMSVGTAEDLDLYVPLKPMN